MTNDTNLIRDRGLTLLQRPFNFSSLNASLNPDNFFIKPDLNLDQSLNSDQGLNFAQETGRKRSSFVSVYVCLSVIMFMAKSRILSA